MRFVIVVPSFPKLSETFIVSKFLGMLAAGWDVHVVCSRSDKDEWGRFDELGQAHRERVHVWLDWVAVPTRVSRVLRQQELLKRYVGEFGRNAPKQLMLDAPIIALQPDILYFAFGALAVGRTYLKRLLGCKLVVSFRGYDINDVGLEQPNYYDAVWQSADAVHFLGQSLLNRARRRGAPLTLLHVCIPPAIDSDLFIPNRAPKRDGPIRLLSVGRLVWKKGLEYSLQAVRLLKEQGYEVEYRIVGGGDYLEALSFARHQLGLESSVQLLGEQPRAVVLDEMNSADIFVHPSVSEGFCNAVLEAQAMQLPIVCSDADGLLENIADGKTGFAVPRRDSVALAQRIRELIDDPERRRAMGQAGRKRVQQHFQLPQQRDAFDAFYRSVLVGRHES